MTLTRCHHHHACCSRSSLAAAVPARNQSQCSHNQPHHSLVIATAHGTLQHQSAADPLPALRAWVAEAGGCVDARLAGELLPAWTVHPVLLFPSCPGLAFFSMLDSSVTMIMVYFVVQGAAGQF